MHFVHQIRPPKANENNNNTRGGRIHTEKSYFVHKTYWIVIHTLSSFIMKRGKRLALAMSSSSSFFLTLVATVWPALLLVLVSARSTDSSSYNDWLPQRLPSPYEGQYTSLASADLNSDGYPDLLISAGKHWVDQPYVLMNLGNDDNSGGVRWSDPLPIGPPAGYYAVEAGRFSFLPADAWGVLLAGGDCKYPVPNQFGSCVPGTTSPALLLKVSVQGCLAGTTGPCNLEWDIVWQDMTHRGDRNGALAYDLGNGVDPAIVLTGVGGVRVFEHPYGTLPTFTMAPEEALPQVDDAITRGTGLVVGNIGTKYTGFFVGTRTLQSAPPAPLVGVWKTGEAQYSWYTMFENNRYQGSARNTIDVQATGLALADLNGDGILDVIESNYLKPVELLPGQPVQQDYSLLNEEGFPTQVATFSWEKEGCRSVDAGFLFMDSELPGVVLGTSGGDVVLFANLGNDDEGNFRGFEERFRFITEDDCEVRGVKIVPNLMRPCAPSVAAVVFCAGRADLGGGFLFHSTAATCLTPAPTDVPTQTPTQSPTDATTSTSTPELSSSIPTADLDDEETNTDRVGSIVDALASAAAADLRSSSSVMIIFLVPLWVGMMTWQW
eukprot:scaffold896_cov172-Amphora_coffeaeformis.AAC.8